MDVYSAFEWLMSYANGMTISFVLAVGVFIDALLGSSWRKANGLRRNSNGFFNGFLKNISLALIPATFWLANILFYYLPPDPTHPQFRYNPLMFDFISVGAGMYIGDWLLHSILANWKLSGRTISPRIERWIQEEYDSKIEQHNLKLDKLGDTHEDK
ncbi:hypothetical protein D3P96_03025 [Weissella viridescens]|uniref:Holin n=1 Tax=Weissella viridescens TaxID=1629 RepID=A0A3P2RKT5_WEIVI|nr:hypothetical protein [Weissella viridescens]RRG18272.1 hypothetical protein D3P96_03025 [Weissella viridescens]